MNQSSVVENGHKTRCASELEDMVSLWRICAKLSQFPIEFALRSWRRRVGFLFTGRETKELPWLYIWIGFRLNHKTVV